MMLKTLLRWRRNVRRFAPRIKVDLSADALPGLDELKRWGEVTLLEDIVVVLHPDGTISETGHTISMPAGQAELEAWDEVAVPYTPREGAVHVVTAKVHLPEGGSRKAASTVVPFAQEIDGKVVQMRARVNKYAPLRPGVVVEQEQAIDAWQRDPLGPHVWREYFLRTQAPCRHRRITVAIAERYTCHIKTHNGAPPPEEHDAFGHRVYRWESRDVPGTVVDNMLPPVRDFIPWVELTTLDSWASVATRYRKDILHNVQLGDIKAKAREVFDGMDDNDARTAAAYRYCTRDVRYGRHPDEVHRPEVRQTPAMLEDMRGDCKDKSVLLKKLLTEAGIESQLVLVATTDQGGGDRLPPGAFNHAVLRARLGDRDVWMDPASDHFGYGELPSSVQGALAIELDGDRDPQVFRVPGPETAEHLTRSNKTGRFEPDGTLRWSSHVSMIGDRAALSRALIESETDQSPGQVLSKWITAGTAGMRIEKIEVDDSPELDKPFGYRYDAVWPGAGKRIRDLLQFELPTRHPFFAGDAPLPETRVEPLGAPTAQENHDASRFTIPEGYEAIDLPEPVALVTPWCEYHVRYEVQGAELVRTRLAVGRGGVIDPEQFAQFREHFLACLAADRTHIILAPIATG